MSFPLRTFFLPIDAVDAPCPVSAWIAVALVDVHLAIVAGRAGPAVALIAVDAILALAAEFAGIALALVDLRLTEVPGEAGEATARE